MPAGETTPPPPGRPASVSGRVPPDPGASDRILLVGVSTRALAESVQAAGHACVSVDAFGDLDQKHRIENVGLQRDLRQPYSAAAVVRRARSLTAASLAYAANFENHPRAVRVLAAGRELLGNTPETLRRVRDPEALQQALRRAGVQAPTTHFGGRCPRDARKRAWLRKPARGGGGGGIQAWSPGDALGPGELIQERIEGTPGSLTFIAGPREVVVAGVCEGLAGDVRFGAPGYRYCGSLFPLAASDTLMERLRVLATALSQEFGLVGLNGIDFVLRDGEPYVLEINPRWCASVEVIERGRGASLFAAHVAACRGGRPALAPAPLRGVFGKAVLYARRDVRIGDSRSWLDRPDVRDVPFPGEHIRSGQPVCTLLARAADRQSCLDRLASRAEQLEQELEVPEPAGRVVARHGPRLAPALEQVVQP